MSSSNPPSTEPKAIGSLVKKQSDVTRMGTQRLKFVPTLPQRRKKEDVKAESVPAALSTSSSKRGNDRGRGDGRGRGRGRGAPPTLEMTASGPFAMGPALSGEKPRLSATRSSFAPAVPTRSALPTGLVPSTSKLDPALLKPPHDILSKGTVQGEDEEEEVYSDPEDGVEIVDIHRLRSLDWMAPDSLRKQKQTKKVKKEAANDGDINMANALDLSESEEEQDLEDIMEDFTARLNVDSIPGEDRLLLFQFPTPFPNFSKSKATSSSGDMPTETTGKKVTFAADVKPEVPFDTPPALESLADEKGAIVEGRIGQLEFYRNGAVKMRLENGILFEVHTGTQPSFFQQAVHLDMDSHRLSVIGEVNKHYIASPDVDSLLTAMEHEDSFQADLGIDGQADLIKMDDT